jgi:EpsI family protein
MRSVVLHSLSTSRRLRLQLYLVIGFALLVFLVSQRFAPPFSSALLQQRLQLFPLQVEDWEGTKGRLDEQVVTALQLDDWILHRYRHPSGVFLWLYIGFLEHQTPQKSHHSPQICYPGAGWELVQQGVQQIAVPEGEPILVNKLLVQKGLERQLVLYWYQWGDRILPEGYSVWGDYGYRLTALLRLLRPASRKDYTLVRVSAPVVDSVEATLAYEIAFIQAAFPLLAKHFALDIAAR